MWQKQKEFLSGNGTYDILMVQLKNVITGEVMVVPEMDFEDFFKGEIFDDNSMTNS